MILNQVVYFRYIVTKSIYFTSIKTRSPVVRILIVRRKFLFKHQVYFQCSDVKQQYEFEVFLCFNTAVIFIDSCFSWKGKRSLANKLQ